MAVKRRRRYPKKHSQFLTTHRSKYDILLAQQGGRCALCPRRPTAKRKLDMDHHHRDMRLRGLLCSVCNRALKDWMDKQWLLRASEYVDRDLNDEEIRT